MQEIKKSRKSEKVGIPKSRKSEKSGKSDVERKKVEGQ